MGPMERRWPGLVLALVAALSPLASALAQSRAPRLAVERRLVSTVAEWQAGLSDGVLITGNQDGELRLAEGRTRGQWVSAPIEFGGTFNALGAVWNTGQAGLPAGTALAIELRGAPDPATLATAPWEPLAAGNAQTGDGLPAAELPRPTASFSRYAQVRITLASNAPPASPILDEITLYGIDSLEGPLLSAATPRRPAQGGITVLTSPPDIVARATWDRQPQRRVGLRAAPRGVIVHRTNTDAAASDALALLRAIEAYQRLALGWEDLAYHFVIDETGNLFEGRLGGPTALTPRLMGDVGSTANTAPYGAVHVLLIGRAAAAPSAAAQDTLARLLAWLGQVYDLPPTGSHTLPNGSTRANVLGHSDADPRAADPGQATRELLPQLRTRADTATVRARWYFAEGNPFSYEQRFAFFNPGSSPATTVVSLVSPGGVIRRDLTIAAGARADLVVNDIISTTTDISAIVEANQAIVVERLMRLGDEFDGGPGVAAPSRVWYFAEGSTAPPFNTYLIIFNPQPQGIEATLTYMLNDGATVTQRVQVGPLSRVVVDTRAGVPPLPGQSEAQPQLPRPQAEGGVGFGVGVTATQPVVVERTMTFGTQAAPAFHTGPGQPALARRWLFAEGTTATQNDFQMRVLVLNPNPQPAAVAVTFFTDDGQQTVRRYALSPTSRLAINVNEVVRNAGMAVLVDSDRPVMAERALYWRNFGAGSISPGAARPAFAWRFADGRTSDGSQAYLLIGNQNRGSALVTVEATSGDGRRDTRTVTVAGGSRYTMALHQVFPGQRALALTVRSTQPVVVERAGYFNTLAGGYASLGVPGD